tara:strand:+ start:9758 stop:10123 length:366 start_codon:yes stop_codon:yes gene_type:complete
MTKNFSRMMLIDMSADTINQAVHSSHSVSWSTAKENGTGGTDHGTGSALFLAGGLVKGVDVKGTWPGLNNQQLFEQRDLMPTSNSFAWFATVLAQLWEFNEQELKQVFPHINAYDEDIILR